MRHNLKIGKFVSAENFHGDGKTQNTPGRFVVDDARARVIDLFVYLIFVSIVRQLIVNMYTGVLEGLKQIYAK